MAAVAVVARRGTSAFDEHRTRRPTAARSAGLLPPRAVRGRRAWLQRLQLTVTARRHRDCPALQLPACVSRSLAFRRERHDPSPNAPGLACTNGPIHTASHGVDA